MAYGFTYTLPTITGSHTDFPVKLIAADFPSAAIDGTSNALANGGGDLVAYTSDAKTTQLPVEVVTFVSSGSPDVEVWVKIGTAATSGTIYIEADDTQTSQPAVTATYGRNAVWSDYEGVFHLGEDPSASSPQMVDSTGNGFDGTSSGSMTSGDSVAAQIGNGLDFDGTNDYIALGTGTGDSIGTGNFTIQQWLSYTATDLRVFHSNANSSTFWFGTDSGIPTSNLSLAATTDISDGSQHLVAYTRTGTSTAVNVDGTEEGTGTSSVNFSGDYEIATFTAARGSFDLPGTMDEVRVSATFRSANWLATEHSNQNASTAWGTVGSWADAGGGGATGKSNPLFGPFGGSLAGAIA